MEDKEKGGKRNGGKREDSGVVGREKRKQVDGKKGGGWERKGGQWRKM